MYPKREYADYYRAGALKKLQEAANVDSDAKEPWLDDICTERRGDDE